MRQSVEFGIERAGWRILFVIAVYLYVMPVVLPALGCYFDWDDVGNIDYHYYQRPPSEALERSVLFFLPYRRPVGGCLYLSLYALFGTADALPYYATGLLIFAANTALFFWLLLRLTGSIPLATLAGAIASLHGALREIWYNFGTVYDQLAFGLMLVSFHLYMSHFGKERRKRRALLGAALVVYILAIGGKEMAVTLPALLLAWEWIYARNGRRRSARLLSPFLRLLPFFAVAIAAAIGRTRSNPFESPLFVYHFDETIFANLADYVGRLTYGAFVPAIWQLLTLFVAMLAAALLLRSRHMLFGWIWFLAALSPVLPLPRTSGFFLYIPMAGLGLYLGALLAELGGRIWKAATDDRPAIRRFRVAAAAAGVLLCLAGLVKLHHARVLHDVTHTFLIPGEARRNFEHDFFARYPSFKDGAALLFLRDPYNDWALHQAIHLYYRKPQTGLEVWAGPNRDLEAFSHRVKVVPEYHVFDYIDGKLVEVDWETVAAGLQKP